MIFLGPMSKNVVDVAIQLTLDNPSINLTFIPSRRQIEYNGGYVNNWTTSEFCKYVRQKNPLIKIERDHGGPGQGLYDDDGYISLKEDSLYMDIIHIDPWKKYQSLEDGIQWTINMINFCNSINPNLEYEIGTEEAIRKLNIDELEEIIIKVKEKLPSNVFLKIKYLVIQCGTALSEGTNTGNFNRIALEKMIHLANNYGLLAKEHNGDWISEYIRKQKQDIGLNYINIAPQLGEAETNAILDILEKNSSDFNKLYEICLKSNKWKKWVTEDFIPEENKKKLISICGHYVFSYPEFVIIKNKYEDIDSIIHSALSNLIQNLCN